MKNFLKTQFEKYTKSKVFRNSLPRGTDLCHDLKILSPVSFCEIWDVGAHKGETALFFANNFENSTIRSFEPVSSNYNSLLENCKNRENIYSYNFALGNQISQTEIHLQGGSVIHSLRDDLNKPSGEDSESEMIRIKTIDSIVEEFKSDRIDLLKIDVEGFEIKVLEGAYKSLTQKKINFIYLETGLDDRFNSIQELIDYLHPTGYVPYAFYEQNPHWTGKQNLWYWNTLFVKENLL